jgi:dienelactone hydrolase
MLGLWPLPEKTPLNATVTGKLEYPGYVVEKLHFQSRPGLYVTANLYRPEPAQGKYPAILYQCGHSYEKRDGNKTAYQDHGIWFATHGYVALVTDSLQLGEIAAIHHGTYREQRWWWHSAGYVPSGVECWNAIRALDYLCSRPDVDPERLGATGISGGGSATMWISAADERIKAAAPVSGMADLGYYVGEDGVNGHCDCMFLYNQARWNWTTIPALICPRPLLFVNSDNDTIFPMSANERIIARLERIYSRFGASDKVDAMVSVGGHAYRTDLRRAIFEFFNRHLKQDARPVEDADAGVAPPGTGVQRGANPCGTRARRR